MASLQKGVLLYLLVVHVGDVVGAFRTVIVAAAVLRTLRAALVEGALLACARLAGTRLLVHVLRGGLPSVGQFGQSAVDGGEVLLVSERGCENHHRGWRGAERHPFHH